MWTQGWGCLSRAATPLLWICDGRVPHDSFFFPFWAGPSPFTLRMALVGNVRLRHYARRSAKRAGQNRDDMIVLLLVFPAWVFSVG